MVLCNHTNKTMFKMIDNMWDNMSSGLPVTSPVYRTVGRWKELHEGSGTTTETLSESRALGEDIDSIKEETVGRSNSSARRWEVDTIQSHTQKASKVNAC